MSAMDGLVASEKHEILRIVGDKHAPASYGACLPDPSLKAAKLDASRQREPSIYCDIDKTATETLVSQ